MRDRTSGGVIEQGREAPLILILEKPKKYPFVFCSSNYIVIRSDLR